MNYTFSEKFGDLTTETYLDAYNRQSELYQDYFHHPLFQHLCFSVFTKSFKVYLLSVFKGEKLIGFMGFREEPLKFRYLKYKFLVPIAYNVAEYNYPVIDKQYIEPFYQTISNVLKDYNVFLPFVPAFFKEYSIQNLKGSFVKDSMGNPILVGANEMLLASNKRTLKKEKRKLLRNHKVEVEHLTENIPEELLEEFFDMHIKRWELDGVESRFKQEKYKEVFKKTAKLKISNSGTPILSYLKINNEFVSFDFGFLFKDTYLAKITATKHTDTTSSAGSILNKESLEYMANNGIENFNLGLGTESYKFRYMNKIVAYYSIMNLKSRLHSFYQRLTLK